jgi:type IV pilus assembly protein PilX
MSFRRQQSGAVLILALVILVIVTLLGTAVMQGATLESKMANNSQERQQAFNAAEAALRQAERVIDTAGFADSELRTNCTGSRCFNANCTNGLCFSGTFGPSDNQSQCLTVPSGSSPPAQGVWASAALDVWNTAGRHVAVDLPGYDDLVAGKYIIEFRCFTDQLDSGGGGGGTVATNTGDVVYRITARGVSQSGRVEAMVQSTYRAERP